MENEVLYRKRECDLCGANAFEKHLGTAKVLDGGYTRVENWESAGFGSMVVVFWEFKHLNRVDVKLCSACAGKLHKAICDAMEEIKGGTEDGK
jgi:hypothetical protein